jgi:chromosome segregation protein
MKWNMGEAGPSRLRAGEMSDLIFSGTKGRASRNSAEVILTIENSSNLLQSYASNDEIEISRKIEKDEGSTYSINNKEVRQRDVQILFADLSIGSRSNAIVDQGQVGNIINSKPLERRKILEEAAGISGIHARKHETELKLRSTEVNLEKLEEIISNDQLRLKELSKQSNQAKRYKNIAENIRKIEAIILYQRWNDTIKYINKNKEELQFYIDNVNEITRNISKKELIKQEIENDLPSLRSENQNYSNLSNKLQVEYNLLINEEENLLLEQENQKDNMSYIEAEILNDTKLYKELKIQSETLSEEIDKLNRNNSKSNLSKINKNLEKVKNEENSILKNLKEAERELNINISQRENFISEIKKLESQKEENIVYLANTKNELDLLNNENINQDKKIIFTKNIEKLKTNLLNLDKEEQSINKNIDTINTEEKNYQANIQKKNISLQNSYRNLEQFNASKNILTKLFESDNNNIVINYLKFPKGYEKAIEASLGHGLKASLEKSAVEWRNISQETLFDLPENINNLAEYAKGVPEVLNILKLTGIVSSTIEGDKLQHKLKPGQQLVTKNGGLWRWDGYTHNEKAETPANQILQNKTNLKNISSKIKKTLSDIEKYKKDIVNLEIKIKNLENSKSKYNNDIKDINKNKTILRNNIEHDQYNLASFIENNSEIRTKIAILESSIEKSKLTAIVATKEIEKFKKYEKSLIKEDILRNNIEKYTLANKNKKDNLTDQISMYQKELTFIENIKQQKTHITNEKIRLTSQIDNILQRLNKLKKRKEGIEHNIKNMKSKPKEIRENKINILNKIEDIKGKFSKIENKLSIKENNNKEIGNELKNFNEELIKERENKARHEGLIQQATEKQKDDKAIINDKLNIVPEDFHKLIDLNEDLPNLEQSNLNLEKLLLQRERIGPVNLVAEQDSEKLIEKLNEIENEKEDLVNAISKLRSSIRTINKEAKIRLMEAFTKVNDNFKILFTELFGGGEAYLALTESDNPLESGLELMASPPGKKLQQMSLLSGGEQALTAMALIFSVFLTKPSPICILDEVDAPLDESNVDRFLDLIESIVKKSKTRFLVVSHNRLTMARMHRLYGVTMQEPGVSQLVSVSLKEAERFENAE